MDPAIDREMIVALIQRVMDADYADDDECDRMLEELAQSVPHPEWSGLIFWPDREMSASEILDVALAYRPIQLGRGDATS